MQSQMIGMQSSLDRILNALQTNAFASSSQSAPAQSQSQSLPTPSTFAPSISSQSPQDMSGYTPSQLQQLHGIPPASHTASTYFHPPTSPENRPRRARFPPLPGFAPPVGIQLFFLIIPSSPVFFTLSLTSSPRMGLYLPQLLLLRTSRRKHCHGHLSTHQSRLYRDWRMPPQKLLQPLSCLRLGKFTF